MDHRVDTEMLLKPPPAATLPLQPFGALCPAGLGEGSPPTLPPRGRSLLLMGGTMQSPEGGKLQEAKKMGDVVIHYFGGVRG